MSKFLKPRRKDGQLSLDLTVKDGVANIDLREGNTPLIKVKNQKFKNINEVLEMLNRKL